MFVPLEGDRNIFFLYWKEFAVVLKVLSESTEKKYNIVLKKLRAWARYDWSLGRTFALAALGILRR